MAVPTRCQLSEMRITDTCWLYIHFDSISAHSFPSNWQLPSLNQRKGETGRRNTSWPNSSKECCRMWGSNPQRPAYWADAHPIELPCPAFPYSTNGVSIKIELFTQQSLISLSIRLNSLSWVLYWLLRAQSCPSWSEFLPSTSFCKFCCELPHLSHVMRKPVFGIFWLACKTKLVCSATEGISDLANIDTILSSREQQRCWPDTADVQTDLHFCCKHDI